MTRVVCTQDDGIATICLSHPARKNILDLPLLEELLSAFAALRCPETRVAILRADAGSSVWSAGFDIAQLQEGDDPLAENKPLDRLFDCIENYQCLSSRWLMGHAGVAAAI